MHKIRNFHEGHSTVGEWQDSGRFVAGERHGNSMGTVWYMRIGLKCLRISRGYVHEQTRVESSQTLESWGVHTDRVESNQVLASPSVF
jgi:hypothetical protein